MNFLCNNNIWVIILIAIILFNNCDFGCGCGNASANNGCSGSCGCC